MERPVHRVLCCGLLLLLLLRNPVTGRLADTDLDQLVRFMLTDTRGGHEDLQLPVNITVRLAVDGLLDRLKCVQQGLTHLECAQCLSAAAVLSVLSPDFASTGTSHLDIEHLSVVLLHHVLNFRSTCKNPPKGGQGVGCSSYGSCRTHVTKRLPISDLADQDAKMLEAVENVLRDVKAVYEPASGQKCFSAETLLFEIVNLSSDQEKPHLEQLATLLMGHLLNGECIDVGEAVTDFLEDLFLHYGDRCTRVITQPGFQKLMSDLKSQGHEEHEDHDMPEVVCTRVMAENEVKGEKKAPPERLKVQSATVGSVQKDSKTVYLLARNEKTRSVPTSGDGETRRRKRGIGKVLAVAHEHRSLASECLSADGLLRKFALNPSQTISPTQFLQLCPALVQQVVSGVCNQAENVTAEVQVAGPSTQELYGYSSLAVLIISLASLCGIFLLPILAKKSYHYVMMGFIGLSFGTMAGDALLHLIPQALGLHSHEETAENDEIDAGVTFDTIPPYLWKQLGVLAAIYGLFLFEIIMSMITGEHEEGHGHSHVPDKLPEALSMKTMSAKTTSSMHLTENQGSIATLDAEGLESQSKQEPVIKSTNLFCGLTSLAVVITIGDTIHNFGDGLAIGASFSSGLRGGLSTALAVFCHELPHEFGDFVVLLSTGLSFWKALTVNFLSALFSFVGLYIGIQLGEDLEAREWILTATAGIFLYVALAEMLPELKGHKVGGPWKMFLVKNIGVLIGIGIMIVIAIYEDHFHI